MSYGQQDDTQSSRSGDTPVPPSQSTTNSSQLAENNSESGKSTRNHRKDVFRAGSSEVFGEGLRALSRDLNHLSFKFKFSVALRPQRA